MKQQKPRTAAAQPDLTTPQGVGTMPGERPADDAGTAHTGRTAEVQANAAEQDTRTADAPTEPDQAEATPPDAEAIARERFAAEAAELRALCPAFDPEEFLRLYGETGEISHPKGAKGELWRAALPWILERVREDERRRTIEAVRARMRQAPETLRAAGAAGSPAADYSGMTSQQFARVRQGVEEQLRLGKRVKL